MQADHAALPHLVEGVRRGAGGELEVEDLQGEAPQVVGPLPDRAQLPVQGQQAPEHEDPVGREAGDQGGERQRQAGDHLLRAALKSR